MFVCTCKPQLHVKLIDGWDVVINNNMSSFFCQLIPLSSQGTAAREVVNLKDKEKTVLGKQALHDDCTCSCLEHVKCIVQ